MNSTEIEIAAKLLQQGETVAFPTETVYGLGANALDREAVAKIFAAKGRPADNPLIIHCYHQAQIGDLARGWCQQAQLLMERFWPGPLTLVLPKQPAVPGIVTGGLDTVALRIPNHPIALALLRTAALPVAAPSANVSGRPSPTRPEHVWQDLAGKISAIIDGGVTPGGLESTVLDCTTSPFRLLRPGGVTVEELRELVPVAIDSGARGESSPRSPARKYQHYAPETQLLLVTGYRIQAAIQEQIQRCREKGLQVAVMSFTESRDAYAGAEIMDLGSRRNLETAASRIYHFLREADKGGFDLVIIEGLPPDDLGLALMDRFRKAAGGRIIQT